MASSIIKYAKGAVALFAVCLIGTATAAPNGNGDEKEEKKEVKETKTTLQSNFLVNKDTNFSPRENVDIDENCDPADTKSCVYQLTSDGMSNIPDQPSYTPAEIEQFETNGWIEPHPDSNPGLYDD